MFKTLSVAPLRKMIDKLTRIEKQHNAFIYKENNPATHLYIVKEGQFRVTKHLYKENLGKELNANEAHKDPLKAVQVTNSFFIKNNILQHELIELQMLGKEQVFGEEDIVMGSTYSTTV